MKSLLTGLAILLAVTSAHAAVAVPNCYQEDQQPSQDPNDLGIKDGDYVVTVSTQDISAKDYALLLNKVEFGQDLYSTLHYTFDGSDLSGKTIEMDFHAQTQTEWKKLVGKRQTPVTFAQVKAATLAFLGEIAQEKGVSDIRCVKNVKMIHHGAGSMSN